MHPNRINEWRVQRGLSYAQVAARVGASESQIFRLANRTTPLTVDWLYRLGEAFDCRPADLLDKEASSGGADNPVAEIVTCWGKLDEDERSEVRQLLLGDGEIPLDLTPMGDPQADRPVQKLIEVRIDDNGRYTATVYYRRAKPRPPKPDE